MSNEASTNTSLPTTQPEDHNAQTSERRKQSSSQRRKSNEKIAKNVKLYYAKKRARLSSKTSGQSSQSTAQHEGSKAASMTGIRHHILKSLQDRGAPGTAVEPTAAVFMSAMVNTVVKSLLNSTVAQAKIGRRPNSSKSAREKLVLNPSHIQDAVQYCSDMRMLALGTPQGAATDQTRPKHGGGRAASTTTNNRAIASARNSSSTSPMSPRPTTASPTESQSPRTQRAVEPQRASAPAQTKQQSSSTLHGQVVILEGMESTAHFVHDVWQRAAKSVPPSVSWHTFKGSTDSGLASVNGTSGNRLACHLEAISRTFATIGAFWNTPRSSDMAATPNNNFTDSSVWLIKHDPLHVLLGGPFGHLAAALSDLRMGLISTADYDMLKSYFQRQWESIAKATEKHQTSKIESTADSGRLFPFLQSLPKYFNEQHSTTGTEHASKPAEATVATPASVGSAAAVLSKSVSVAPVRAVAVQSNGVKPVKAVPVQTQNSDSRTPAPSLSPQAQVRRSQCVYNSAWTK